jgi:hypothetical protein
MATDEVKQQTPHISELMQRTPHTSQVKQQIPHISEVKQRTPHISTYDPIGERHGSIPDAETGTVTVGFQGERAWLVKGEQESRPGRMRELWILGVCILGVGLFALQSLFTGHFSYMLWSMFVLAILIAIAIIRETSTTGYYLVKIGEKKILDEVGVQFNTGVFARVEMEYRAVVWDPEEVVKRGIRDAREFLSGELHAIIHRLAHSATLEDRGSSFLAAVRAIEWNGDESSLFGVDKLNCQVIFDGEIGKAISALAQRSLEIEAIKAENEKAEAERAYYQKLTQDPDLLHAEMLRPGTNKELLQQAAQIFLANEQAQLELKLKMIDLGFKTGVLQEHTVRTKYSELYQAFENAVRGFFNKAVGNSGLSTLPPLLAGHGNGTNAHSLGSNGPTTPDSADSKT